jgi:long-chain acyl-CoA synthetase
MALHRALTLDVVGRHEAGTLAGLFDERCTRSPAREAYRQVEGGAWRSHTWYDMRLAVDRWRGALACEQLERGDRVAVMLKNCVEWVCFDQAAHSLGLVVVPLYPTDNPGNAAYILGDSGARVLLLGDGRVWPSLEPLRGQFPQLQRVVCVSAAPQGAGLVRDLQGWLADAPAVRPVACEPGQLATIVYTSGTTGRPKGVMLSHRNILANVQAVLQVVHGYREDLFLSFLPLSHTLERTVGYYLPMTTGSTVAFARSVQDLAEDLLAVRPTMLVSVPRVYERIYAKLQQGLEQKGTPARALFAKAEEIGWHRFLAEQRRGVEPGVLADLMWPVLRHLVADKLLERLGGRIRIAVSGGAPISPTLTHCFIGLGLPLLQGYGLTEAAPIVTANTLEDNRPASVGRAIPGVTIRLGDDDELLVRGPNVMMGYWNRPEDTRAAIDEDGWLHTGDVARMDGEQHIYIVGRLKEILVTSTGEKVPPADLEIAICEDPLFEQVLVVGEQRPSLAALAVVNEDAWQALAGSLGVDADAPGALELPSVQDAVLGRIAAHTANFPSYARIRAVWLTREPWSVDNGLLTPTLKARRRVIEQRFTREIERLYGEKPGSAARNPACEPA